MRKSVIVASAAALLGLGACGDRLDVRNMTSPDLARVLSTAEGVESTIGGLGAALNNTQRTQESINTQAKIMAEETFATVANFGMAARVANRSLISNELGNDHTASNFNNYNQFQRTARNATNSLYAFNTIVAAGQNTLPDDRVNRMRAFAYLILGQAYGNISLGYDSASVADESMATDVIPDLFSAAEVNAAAIAAFDSAIAIASRGMANTPDTWVSGVVLNQADFIRLARSYRARIRANVARSVAERAAVDWNAVLQDVLNGITADHEIQIGGTTGWSASYDANQIYVTTGGWHMMPLRYIGMADTLGNYQNWVNGTKRAFLVATPDLRWPQGDNRADQQDNTVPTPANSIAPAYLMNRPTGQDVIVASPGESHYMHHRFGVTRASSTGGPYTDMSKVEMDMLAAEAYIRLGQPENAVPLVNISRERNNLPPIDAAIGLTGVVPGGSACVPRLPNGNCATLWEAMKYEKRMETAYTGYLTWFADSRGWGDLMPTTVVEWPVPYQEIQARGLVIKNGTRQTTDPNTYGFTN